MKKILIFGATGYVGAYLTDYLMKHINQEEYEIVAVGRRTSNFFSIMGIQYYQVDVTKQEMFNSLPTEDVYAIVNLTGILPAYVKNTNPYAYVNTNIIGALNILEYARKCNVDRVIYSQTWAVQAGYWGKELTLKPDLTRKLVYTGDHAFYSITKSTVEDMLEYYKQEYGIKNFVFRLPNIYMYAPNKTYMVDGVEKKIGYRYMIDTVKSGHNLEMWGDPNAFKDILYVKDLCQMMYLAILCDKDGGVYNAGTGIKTTLKEQLEGMVKIFAPVNSQVQIIPKPEKESFVSFVMDIDNIKKDLGYEPKYTYLKYLEDYKKEEEAKRFDELWKK